MICPDIAVVLDDNLLEMVNVTSNLREGGLVVVNTSKDPQKLGLEGPFTIAVADAFHASEAAGLIVEGNVLISTSILGPFAAASDLVSMQNIQKAVGRKFKGAALDRNIMALEFAYKSTQISRFQPPAASISA